MISVPIATWARYGALLALITLNNGIKVVVGELGEPVRAGRGASAASRSLLVRPLLTRAQVLVFNVYNPDKRVITDFTRAQLLFYANAIAVVSNTRRVFELMVSVTQIDIAVFSIVVEQAISVGTVSFLVSEKTFERAARPQLLGAARRRGRLRRPAVDERLPVRRHGLQHADAFVDAREPHGVGDLDDTPHVGAILRRRRRADGQLAAAQHGPHGLLHWPAEPRHDEGGEHRRILWDLGPVGVHAASLLTQCRAAGQVLPSLDGRVAGARVAALRSAARCSCTLFAALSTRGGGRGVPPGGRGVPTGGRGVLGAREHEARSSIASAAVASRMGSMSTRADKGDQRRKGGERGGKGYG